MEHASGLSTLHTAGSISGVRSRLRGISVEIGIPSYNEGRSIVPTLKSLAASASECGIQPVRMILSDSSDSEETVVAAREWAAATGIELLVDRSSQRRSLKEALNVIFQIATADILIEVNADVIVPAQSLSEMLYALTENPRPALAVGLAAPDPSSRAWRRRASAWQMKVTGRLASWADDDAPRAEGAFWGAWRDLYSTYRYEPNTGSIADDIELVRHVVHNDLRIRNVPRALAFKVPAGTLADFHLQTQRYFAAAGGSRRTLRHVGAAAVEGARDPIGLVLYITSRCWSALRRRRGETGVGERWDVAQSTRRESDD